MTLTHMDVIKSLRVVLRMTLRMAVSVTLCVSTCACTECGKSLNYESWQNATGSTGIMYDYPVVNSLWINRLIIIDFTTYCCPQSFYTIFLLVIGKFQTVPKVQNGWVSGFTALIFHSVEQTHLRQLGFSCHLTAY